MSNSFAAPYITSLVANLYATECIINAAQAKYALCRKLNLDDSVLHRRRFDWCYKAIIINYSEIRILHEHIPFNIEKIYMVNNQHELISAISRIDTHNIDTLILVCGDDDYALFQQNYTVKDIYVKRLTNNPFKNSHKSVLNREVLEIPIIWMNSNSKNELFSFLAELQKRFHNEGYNCKVILDYEVGQLYDFIYSKYSNSYLELVKVIETECIDIILISSDYQNFDFEADVYINLDCFNVDEYFNHILKMFD